MASLGDLIVRVGANIAEFESSMATVSARLDTISSEVDQKFAGFSSIGQTLAGAGAALTAGLTLPIAGLGSAAIQAAGAMEQAKTGFTTLLGSGQAATQMLADLQKFALGTPFQFPELATAAQRLLAMGTNAKDIIPTMTSIGNAVSAMGKGMPEFDRIALAFSQMSNSAKLSAGDMRQFTESGVGAWRYLSQATGISMSEIQEKAKGVLTGSQAAQIILQGMQKDFGGGMEAQSKTLLGMWSNVQDAIKFTLGDIGNILLPLGKRFIDEFLNPALTGLKDLAHWFAGLPEPIQNGALALAAMLAAAGPLVLAIGGISVAIGVLAPAITGIAAFLGISTAAFLGWAAAIPLAVAALVALGAWISSNWGSIKAVVSQAWDGVSDLWGAAWSGITTAITGTWNGFASLASTAWNGVAGLLGSLWDGITSLWSSAWSTIISGLSTAWSGVSGVASSAWSATSTYFSTLWDGLGPTWTTVWSTITGTLSAAWGGVSGAATTTWGAVTGFFSTVWDSVSGWFDTAWSTITTGLTTAWGAVSTAVATIWNPIASFFSTIWDGISSAWNTVWTGISGVLSGLWNGIKTAATTAWGAVSTAIQTFMEWAAKIPGVSKLLNLDDAWKSAQTLAQKTNDAAVATKTHATELGKATTAHTTHAAAVEKTGNAYNTGAGHLKTFNAEEQNLLKKLADIRTKQNDANKVIEKWNQDVKDGKGPLNDLAHALDGYRVDIDRMTPDMKALNRVLEDSNDLTRDAKKYTDDLARAFGTLKSKSETDLYNAYVEAKKNFDLISGSGVATQQQVDESFGLMLQAERDYKTGLGQDTSDLDAKLDGMLQKHKDHETDVKGVWGQISSDIDFAIDTFANSLGGSINDMLHGDFSWDSLKSAVSGLKDDIIDAFTKQISQAISDFIKGAMADLLGGKGFGGLKDLLGDVWDKMKDIFGVGADGVIKNATDGGGSSIPGTGGGSGTGGGGSTGGGGVMGAVNMVSGIVSAITGVIGVFQNMHQETSLNAIEHNTRYSMMFLGERADQGILGILFKIDEEIAWGSTNKMIMSIKDKFLGWADIAMGNLDEIKSTLWAIRDSMGNIASVQMAPAAAGGGAGATVNINNATILDQRTVDTVARRVVDTLRRGGGRI